MGFIALWAKSTITFQTRQLVIQLLDFMYWSAVLPNTSWWSDKIHDGHTGITLGSDWCNTGVLTPLFVFVIFPELARNREFYRTHDVRPPFTYVDLIRQVVRK